MASFYFLSLIEWTYWVSYVPGGGPLKDLVETDMTLPMFIISGSLEYYGLTNIYWGLSLPRLCFCIIELLINWFSMEWFLLVGEHDNFFYREVYFLEYLSSYRTDLLPISTTPSMFLEWGMLPGILYGFFIFRLLFNTGRLCRVGEYSGIVYTCVLERVGNFMSTSGVSSYILCLRLFCSFLSL